MEKLDSELPVVEAILVGDRDAFEEFVRRQSKWVRGIVFGVLGDVDRVDDVCQQVWTTVWRQASTLQQPQRWRSWLYRLARNAAMDAGREITRRRKLQRRIQHEYGSGSVAPAPHRSIQSDERTQALLQAITALPALYREPFVLRHLQNWSYREIAEVMEMPVDTVETRLVRARRHLREALKDKI